jgi:hypothetical protein
MLDPVQAPETVEVIGYGSPTAMEAACDALIVWSRAAPSLRLVIGGLVDGKSQIDIASEMRTNRFKVARMIKLLKSQFVRAA